MTDVAILRDPEDFNYQVFWSQEDQAWIGIVDELPSLSWVADDRNSAADGIRRLVWRTRQAADAAPKWFLGVLGVKPTKLASSANSLGWDMPSRTTHRRRNQRMR